MAAAEVTAPATPCTEAEAASVRKSTNLGNAVAAKIPRITITTISSISVKPFCTAFMEVSLTQFKKLTTTRRQTADDGSGIRRSRMGIGKQTVIGIARANHTKSCHATTHCIGISLNQQIASCRIEYIGQSRHGQDTWRPEGRSRRIPKSEIDQAVFGTDRSGCTQRVICSAATTSTRRRIGNAGPRQYGCMSQSRCCSNTAASRLKLGDTRIPLQIHKAWQGNRRKHAKDDDHDDQLNQREAPCLAT